MEGAGVAQQDELALGTGEGDVKPAPIGEKGSNLEDKAKEKRNKNVWEEATRERRTRVET